MENIPSLTPGAHTMAHWPGICSKSFPPSGACHTECLYIRCLLTDICDHAYLGDQSIQRIIFMTGTFAHHCSPPCFCKCFDHFHNIQGSRTFFHAAAASYTGIHAVIVGREINQLVHESLTESLHLAGTVISVRHHGESRNTYRNPSSGNALHHVPYHNL